MSYFQNNSWQKWVFIGLVVLNMLSLGIIWTKNGPPVPKFGNSNQRPENKRRQADIYLLNQLGYDEDQRKAFFDLTEQHIARMRGVHDQLRKSKKALFDLLQQTDVDSNQVASLGNDIAKWQVQIEESTFYHFKAIRALGSAKQQEKFDSIIIDALKMVGSPLQREQQEIPPRR